MARKLLILLFLVRLSPPLLVQSNYELPVSHPIHPKGQFKAAYQGQMIQLLGDRQSHSVEQRAMARMFSDGLQAQLVPLFPFAWVMTTELS